MAVSPGVDLNIEVLNSLIESDTHALHRLLKTESPTVDKSASPVEFIDIINGCINFVGNLNKTGYDGVGAVVENGDLVKFVRTDYVS